MSDRNRRLTKFSSYRSSLLSISTHILLPRLAHDGGECWATFRVHFSRCPRNVCVAFSFSNDSLEFFLRIFIFLLFTWTWRLREKGTKVGDSFLSRSLLSIIFSSLRRISLLWMSSLCYHCDERFKMFAYLVCTTTMTLLPAVGKIWLRQGWEISDVNLHGLKWIDCDVMS